MNDSGVTWYSMNLKLKVEEHEAISLDEAIKIVDRYLARGGEKFQTAEEAIAATMFGFSRSKSEFIEICVNGPIQISYKFEVSDPEAPWYRKMFGGVFQHDEELHSREEMVQKVEEFFTTPVLEIKRQLESR
jgi:hypothetical protein